MTITLRDLFTGSVLLPYDIDIVDDYTGECYIAYCGTRATEDGLKEYSEALDIELTPQPGYTWIARIDRGDDRSEHLLDELKRLLYDAAGYCSMRQYRKCFVDD